MSRFVILAAARTGTNRLVTQFCAQPDIWCNGEVLKPGKMPVRRPGERLKQKLIALRESDFDAFLKRIFTMSRQRPHCGFKVLLGHLNEQNSAGILDDPGILKVVLSRENILACYSSALAAHQTGAWNSTEMANTERLLVTFKAHAFDSFRDTNTERYAALSARLGANGQTPFHLRTEDLNDRSRIAEMLAFLGAANRVVEPDETPARGPSDILSRFSNPAEAENYLREHDLMHWAREGPAS